MTENFLNWTKETGIEVQEVQKVPNKIKRPTPRYIIIKTSKAKD